MQQRAMSGHALKVPQGHGVSLRPCAPTFSRRTSMQRSSVLSPLRVIAEPPTSPATAPEHELRTISVAESMQPINSTPLPSGGDPWEDEKWTKYKWTVYRGVAYDLTPYLDKHPGGRWLLNLAVGRDATALFESYHLRPEVAVARLNRLPKLEGFPIAAVPRSPYPNDSELYNAIRDRVRNELFKGQDGKGAHRSGSEGAALAVLGTAVATYAMYTYDANILTGAIMGLAGAWIGLTIQHCGNHGAMSTNPLINNFLGMTNDISGGSSLMWRYHHQVSHHIHCNDDAFDEDVFSSFPLLRFDNRLPRQWHHRFQHIYMWMTFPFLQLAFQYGDWQAFFTGRTAGASTYGAGTPERVAFVLGKLAHYSIILAVPWMLHGGVAAVTGWLAYVCSQSIVLASTFAVSHNVPETKPVDDNSARANLFTELAERDWGVQQVLTSANWGGVIGNFFTGGLNLQIEHHLFPAIAFMHYPAISKIVEDECNKRGIPYAHYPTLTGILARFTRYMSEAGLAEQVPMKRDGEMVMLTRL